MVGYRIVILADADGVELHSHCFHSHHQQTSFSSIFFSVSILIIISKHAPPPLNHSSFLLFLSCVHSHHHWCKHAPPLLETLSPFSYSFRVTLCRKDMKDSSNSSSRDDQTYNKRCNQSVSQEMITTKEDRFERERVVVLCPFSCARQLASPWTHTPAESSSSPLPRSTTSRCWISAPHNHHQSMHLSVLSQIILPQNAVKIRVLTFFGNVYSRRNGKLCIDRRKMAPPHLLPLPSPSEEDIFFNRMQNRTNCCENKERLLIKKSGTR